MKNPRYLYVYLNSTVFVGTLHTDTLCTIVTQGSYKHMIKKFKDFLKTFQGCLSRLDGDSKMSDSRSVA